MGYLDNTGLAYFWEKIKSTFFPATKDIPENADLNDYKIPGAYVCRTNAAVATLDNVPTTKAFSLIVYRTGNSNSCVQYVSIFSTGLASQGEQDEANRIFTRTYYWDNDWSPWAEIVTSLDKPVNYTSAGWSLDTYADHCWHKMATFRSTNTNTDRRAVFLVTDSLWYGTSAPNGRPDLKIGLLHVHIRKTVGTCATNRRLSFNLNTGYDPNDFVLVYNPVDDSDELWTRIPTRYDFRTFNLIETGLNYGGNRYYQTTANPIEMYRRVRDVGGYDSYPTGDGYVAIKAENSVVEQPSRGLLDLGVYYNKTSTKRLTSANNLPCGDASLKYFNSTSSMTVAEGKPVHTKSLSEMDAHVLHLSWDNAGGYDGQIAIPNNFTVPADPDVIKTVQWRSGTGKTTTLEDGTTVQTDWSDWQHIVDSQFTFDGIHPNYRHVSRYAVCSTAAATAAKTVDIPNFELVTGALVVIRFSVTNTAAVASLTLEVTGTGAKSIKYRNGNVSAVGTLAANRTYMFVYDGTYWQLIGDLDTDKNDDHYERLRTYCPVKAKSAITKQHVIVAGEDGLYFMLTSGSPFSIKYPPLYATAAISAGAKSTSAYYFCFLDTAVITNEAAETLTLNKALYIKGHLNDTMFTPFATKSLVCTEPTTEDGYQYLKLGVVKAVSTSSDELRCQIEIEHPIYEYVNGSFCLYEPKATNAEIDSIFD